MGIAGDAVRAAWARESNTLARNFVEKQMGISRDSSAKLFDRGEAARLEGNAQALATLENAYPLQQEAFLQGNADAAQRVESGVQPFQNAILGGDYSQPRRRRQGQHRQGQGRRQGGILSGSPSPGGILSGSPISIGPSGNAPTSSGDLEGTSDLLDTESLLNVIYDKYPEILDKKGERNKKVDERIIGKRGKKIIDKYDVPEELENEFVDLIGEQKNALQKRRKLRQFRRNSRRSKKAFKKAEGLINKYNLDQWHVDKLYKNIDRKKRRKQKDKAVKKFESDYLKGVAAKRAKRAAEQII